MNVAGGGRISRDALSSAPFTSVSVSKAVSNRQWRLLINGELCEAVDGRYYDNESPVTESVICRIPDAGKADIEKAVRAAHSAQEKWAQRSVRSRASMVRALAGVVREHREELAALDAIDVGNVYATMLIDVDWAADTIELMADMSYGLTGQTFPGNATHLSYTRREPYGVVARIIAFNHPILFAAQKIAAPLVAGNSLILKPSDAAPLSALRLGEIFAEHLPPGVLNVVVGRGIECPRALVRHPAVKRIGFIGSPDVGRAIQKDAAEVAVKQITLELGGKNALIVCPDADMEAAAVGAVRGMNFVGWQSQSCMSTSRVIVPRRSADKIVELIKARVEKIVIGDPFGIETEMGTLASRGQYEKTTRYVDIAKADGAALITGGVRPANHQTGHYFSPTIFADVAPKSRIAQEEVFGPIMSILEYDDLQEAITIANSVPYGLTGSVWSKDGAQAHRVAHALEAGYIWINDSSAQFEGVPFGGYKNSGIGQEEGMEELLSYSQVKAINVKIG